MYRQEKTKQNSIFENLDFYGTENDTVLDKICAFLLALSPILQHYSGIYKNAGFTVLLLLSPYLVLKLLIKIRDSSINSRYFVPFVFLLSFQIYRLIDHEINAGKIFYFIFMVVCFFAVAYGCVNMKYFIGCAAVIAVSAGILLILQYICYYIFGFHFQLVPTSLLLPESSAWILGAQTGLVGVNGRPNGFYRPSAFFLEPSHLFIYSFPILALLLLSQDKQPWKIKMAVVVSFGLVLSTSGMGIAVTLAIWAVYFILYSDGLKLNFAQRVRKIITAKNVLLVVIIIGMLFVAYFQVDFIKNAVDRIITPKQGSSSAIDGRTELAKMLVDDLSGSNLIFGLTEDVSDINFNLSGFYSTLYKYGIIGIIFSYLFYVSSLFKLKNAYFWITAIIVIISYFTAHTHGTFYMLYYIIILMNGYYASRKVKTEKDILPLNNIYR